MIIIIKEGLFKFWETGSGFLWNRALEDTEFQQNVWGWVWGVRYVKEGEELTFLASHYRNIRQTGK